MTTKKNSPLLGAHISISKGFANAVKQGAEIGCTTIQIFTSSVRQWRATVPTEAQIAAFLEAKKTYSMPTVVSHASYLINLGSAKESTVTQAVQALTRELEVCHMLDIPYLVLHPGSNTGNLPQKEILDRIGKLLHHIVTTTKSKTMVVLELMAGQGTVLCSTFEEIAYLIKASGLGTKIGVGFDTCHVFAAGYDIRTKEGYETTWKAFDTIIGLKKLKVIHLNDSKKALGSRVDRHELIGEGLLGVEFFKLLMNDKRFAKIPKILETPHETYLDFAAGIALLKKLAE